MPLPRTVPVAVALGAAMYVPLLGLRFALGRWQAISLFGVEPALFARYASCAGLVLISLAAMASCRDVGWREFGFRRPDRGWMRYAVAAVALGLITSIFLKLVSGGGLDASVAGIRPVALLGLVLAATIAEELFVRGWMQGFLEPLNEHAVNVMSKRVSVPVLTGALFFGAMHLSLTKLGVDVATLATIFVFTIVLGLLAGLARSISGSLEAAVLTHLAGNFGGIVGGIIYVLATGAHPNP
jgi:membrane protease YdiL (CAAX protease family)